MREAARAAALEQEAARRRAEKEEQTRLAEEIQAQSQVIRRATVAQAPAGTAETQKLVVVLESSRALPSSEIQRLKRWLAVRVSKREIELFVGGRPA